jgi:hypothetical protein
VDVRIGIVQSMKEIELEMAEETDRADIEGQVASAVSADGMLWLTDRKGRRVGVPASKIAYIEIGPSSAERRVGFGA